MVRATEQEPSRPDHPQPASAPAPTGKFTS